MNDLLLNSWDEVSSVQFAGWAACLLIFMGFLSLGIKLKDQIWPKAKTKQTVTLDPQPLPVSITKDLATKDEVEELKVEMKDGFAQVDRKLQTERNNHRSDLIKVHERVDKLVENTSQISGQMEQMNKNLNIIIQSKING